MQPAGDLQMTPNSDDCWQSATTGAYALGVLSADETGAAQAHLVACPACREELASLSRVTESFAAWPVDVLSPAASLKSRLSERIGAKVAAPPVAAPARDWIEPVWEAVAPGIECKLLASDGERHRVSMLVRLAPGASYPAHIHAGEEELYLLDGELWIDDRKLRPGDYNHGAPGAADHRVWSQSGCTCLLITDTRDVLTP